MVEVGLAGLRAGKRWVMVGVRCRGLFLNPAPRTATDRSFSRWRGGNGVSLCSTTPFSGEMGNSLPTMREGHQEK